MNDLELHPTIDDEQAEREAEYLREQEWREWFPSEEDIAWWAEQTREDDEFDDLDERAEIDRYLTAHEHGLKTF